MNSINITGRLVRDPEQKVTTGGTELTNIRIAVDQRNDTTGFYDVTCFGKTGQSVAQYKRKGEQVAITGRLDYREWTNEQGQKRSRVEIVAEHVDFIGPRSESKPDAAPAAPVPDDDIPF